MSFLNFEGQSVHWSLDCVILRYSEHIPDSHENCSPNQIIKQHFFPISYNKEQLCPWR